MNIIDFSGFTFTISDMEDNKPVNVFEMTEAQQGTMAVSETVEDSVLTDDFVINMVDGMDGSVLSTIDYDMLKLAPAESYTDLVSLETQNLDVITLAQEIMSPESSTLSTSASRLSPVPSPSYFETTQYSPVSNPLSPSIFCPETPESVLSAAEESITVVVCPNEVFGEEKKAPGKKRGRKPKSEQALHQIQKKQKKTKVYEINQPFEDKTMERKRLNAVNAKRHRDLQKKAREDLETQLNSVRNERDKLKEEVQSLRAKEVELASQLELFKNHIKSQQNSALTLLQSTSTF